MAMQIIQIEIAGAPCACRPGAIVKKITFDLGLTLVPYCDIL